MGEFRPSRPGERRGGRKKGTLNKIDQTIKDMVVQALHQAGGVDYLAEQARANPVAFMGLVGRAMPLQVTGENGGALVVDFRWADAPQPTAPAVADETTTIDADTTDVTFIGEC